MNIEFFDGSFFSEKFQRLILSFNSSYYKKKMETFKKKFLINYCLIF